MALVLGEESECFGAYGRRIDGCVLYASRCGYVCSEIFHWQSVFDLSVIYTKIILFKEYHLSAGYYFLTVGIIGALSRPFSARLWVRAVRRYRSGFGIHAGMLPMVRYLQFYGYLCNNLSGQWSSLLLSSVIFAADGFVVMLIQLIVVLAAIVAGARLGGIGLGVLGGAGLAVLVFMFGLEPTSPPIVVMLMIVAVIAAAACMQAAGGLDLMVRLAERILRSNPRRITLLSPLVTYTFTFVAGTGHVAYSVLPVIAEVAAETGIRPERPMSIAVIASQQAITASPISAATVALLSLLAGNGFEITLGDILMISIPCTLAGVIIGALCSLRVGKELKEDPEYLRRVKEGEFSPVGHNIQRSGGGRSAAVSVILFLAATVGIVLFGSVPKLRPVFEGAPLSMAYVIEIVMLTAAAFILIVTRTDGIKAVKGSVFSAGMQAVVAIFGIAWMGDTFIAGNMAEIKGAVEETVTRMPWLFGVALFTMSILLFSQAATIRALLPLGLALGISPYMLIALFPAVNGYFFIPNYPTVVAAINFDRTGTTHIGRYILNHSFMMPGMVATVTSVGLGILCVNLFF